MLLKAVITGTLCLGVGVLSLCAEGLDIEGDGSRVRVSKPGSTAAQVHHLETSPNLIAWKEAAFSTTAFNRYGVAQDSDSGFFRVRSRHADDASDWSNQLSIFDTRMFTESGGASNPAFAKFTMVLDEPERVYFQDTERYPFHFHFAQARLPGYDGISFQEYTRASLFTENQELAVGTVLLSPDPSVTEVAIQFTGNDPFPIEAIADWYRTVRLRTVAPERWRFFYLPSFEQSGPAFDNEAWFAKQGILVDTAARWITENACYSDGWALGQLKFFPAGEIDAAYGDGRLTHLDILVTDQVPAEIPVVAGLVTLAPATPNSHVAILSKSFRIPFAYPSGAALQDQVRAMAMEGRDVLLVVSIEDGVCRIRIDDVDGKLTPEEREAIIDSKKPPEVSIEPIVDAGAYHLNAGELTPDAVIFAGGKAANFGFLRRAIPENSPEPAIALTFDLWNDFMAQSYRSGLLGESIAQDLGEFTFPPDLASLRPVLETIRSRIQDETTFSPDQEAVIVAALTPFDESRRIRFRSSTNVEDSAVLSGAGLYDSFSGCLADDTDGDTSGPSKCDAKKANERGVFRAIRKVYASFYNENAFIERLRHGIDEAAAGMAILAHYSFPDELEWANGVATLEIRKPADVARMVSMQLVSQSGANSITNPNNEFLPEIVSAHFEGLPESATFNVEQRSALVEEGENVLTWPDEYGVLLSLLNTAALAYESFYPAEQILDLDFEWKKVAPGDLVVKQIRRIPRVPIVPPPAID